MRLRHSGLFGLLALAFSTGASADPSLHFVGGTGLSWGGDTLAKVDYNNGDKTQIKAGGLFYIQAGGSVELTGSPLSMEALYGYQVDNDDAANGDVKFDRSTLDALLFYNAGNHHFGAGAAWHYSPEYHSSGYYDPNTGQPLPSADVRFKDSNGFELAYEYRPPHSHFGLMARAVSMKYDVESVTINGQPGTASKTSWDGSFISGGITLYL